MEDVEEIYAIETKCVSRKDLSRSLDSSKVSMNRWSEFCINESTVDIYIKNIHGTIITIDKASYGVRLGKFSIFTRHTLTHNAMESAREGLVRQIDSGLDLESSTESLKMINEIDYYDIPNASTRDYVLETSIDTSTMIPTAVYYLSDLGYLVSQDFSALVDTPHILANKNILALINQTYEPEGTGFYIDIVDNEERMGVRYTKIFGSLKVIDPIKDVTRISGIHLRYTTPEATDRVYYPLTDDLESLGLYTSIEEALNGNDLEFLKTKAKIEALNIERKTNDLTLEHKYSETEMSARLKELERRNKELDLELSKVKTIRDYSIQERDAYYSTRKLQLESHTDQISHTNKTNLEMLKMIPAVATFAVLMYAIFKGKS